MICHVLERLTMIMASFPRFEHWEGLRLEKQAPRPSLLNMQSTEDIILKLPISQCQKIPQGIRVRLGNHFSPRI